MYRLTALRPEATNEAGRTSVILQPDYMNELLSLHSGAHWATAFLACFTIGLGKAGLKGMDMLSVTLLAFIFGSKASTGIVLPLLCTADLAAVIYYRRHAQWKHFWALIPWMMAGILLGVYTGNHLNEADFRNMMAGIILITIVLILAMEYTPLRQLPGHPLFASCTGMAAGFTTMLGNLAGAFANLYFLGMRVSKNDFIGTAAWIFLSINLFKLPFQILVWKNIHAQSLQTDALLLPALALGFAAGIFIVDKINDRNYRKLVMVLTLAGALLLLFR